MAGYIILAVVILIVYFDARTLRRESEELYTDIIKYRPFIWSLFAFLLFIVVAPWYYYRRHSFLTRLRATQRKDPSIDILVSAETPSSQELTVRENSSATAPSLAETPYFSEPSPNFYQIIEMNGVVLAWFWGVTVLSLLYSVIAQIFPVLSAELLQYAILGVMSSVVMLYLIYHAIKIRSREGFWKSLAVKKGSRFWMRSLLIPGLVGLMLAVVNFRIITSRGMESPSPLGQALGEGNLLSWIAFLCMGILTAPLLEELIFRGYFFSAFRRLKGTFFAIGCVTVLFAFFHVPQLWGDWLGVALIFGLAFALTLLRAWSGSTIPGIVTHYVYNTLIVLVLPLSMLYFSSPAYFQFSLMSAHLDAMAKEQLLKQSIATHPEYTPAYNALAWMYAEQEVSLDEAVSLIKIALDFEPDNSMFLDTKAEVLYKLQRYDEAIEIEEGLVVKYPNNSFYKKQLDKFRQALAAFQSSPGAQLKEQRPAPETSEAEASDAPQRSKPENVLAIGPQARIDGVLDIGLNPPEEFDFKEKAEIYRIRTAYVQEYPGLLQGDYWPSEAIFGAIVSGRPWWGVLGESYYGNGKNSIEGPSEESRFVSNPFLLVGLRDKYARRIPAGYFSPQAIYPEPHGLTWNAETSFLTVTYDISAYWKKYADSYPKMPFTELDAFTLIAYNARDLGLKSLYLVPNKSKKIVWHNPSENAVVIPQMIHQGGSCGYPGGCNNMSPDTPTMNVTVNKVPATIHIKLWKDSPKDVDEAPDMTVVLELI